MALNKIKVNSDMLASDARSISEYITNIEGWIASLESDYMALDSMWDGPANQVYAIMFRRDLDKIKGYINILKQINNYEQTAKDKYNSCVSSVNETIAGIRV